jgi:hypothetical protein
MSEEFKMSEIVYRLDDNNLTISRWEVCGINITPFNTMLTLRRINFKTSSPCNIANFTPEEVIETVEAGEVFHTETKAVEFGVNKNIKLEATAKNNRLQLERLFIKRQELDRELNIILKNVPKYIVDEGGDYLED